MNFAILIKNWSIFSGSKVCHTSAFKSFELLSAQWYAQFYHVHTRGCFERSEFVRYFQNIVHECTFTRTQLN